VILSNPTKRMQYKRRRYCSPRQVQDIYPNLLCRIDYIDDPMVVWLVIPNKVARMDEIPEDIASCSVQDAPDLVFERSHYGGVGV